MMSSRPIVRPVRPGIALTAATTPGMNDVRSVGVLADRERLPRRAEQHLLVGDEPLEPHPVDRGSHRVHDRLRAPGSTSLVVGSAAHSLDAAAIRSAVAMEVPEWRVDLAVVVELDDLTVGNHGAAARRSASSAPALIAKFATTEQPDSPNVSSNPARSSSVSPVVPTTACTPFAAHQARSARPRRGP